MRIQKPKERGNGMMERRRKVEFVKFKQYVDFNEDVVNNIMSGFVSLQKQCNNNRYSCIGCDKEHRYSKNIGVRC